MPLLPPLLLLSLMLLLLPSSSSLMLLLWWWWCCSLLCLNRLVPPEYPLVLNRWGHQLNGTMLGPMEEGDDIVLTCRVTGGKPRNSIPSLFFSLALCIIYTYTQLPLQLIQFSAEFFFLRFHFSYACSFVRFVSREFIFSFSLWISSYFIGFGLASDVAFHSVHRWIDPLSSFLCALCSRRLNECLGSRFFFAHFSFSCLSFGGPFQHLAYATKICTRMKSKCNRIQQTN